MKSKLKMRLLFIVFLYTCCIHICLCQTDTPIAVNNSDEQDDGIYKSTVESVRVTTLKTMTNCSLVLKFPDVRNKIATLANVGNKLVKFNLEIVGDRGLLNDTYPGSIYNPHLWVISTSLTGNAMLMLKEYFDAMSLNTLGHGVASVSLTLIQDPEDCLNDAQVEDIENIIRLQFLNNFGAEENELPEEAVICNSHIVEAGETVGRLVYICCNKELQNDLQCSELKESVWFQILFISITVLQVLIILYSPSMLPDSVYKARTVFQKYVFETEPGKLLKLNVKKVAGNVDNGFIKTRKHSFTHLTSFNAHLKDLLPGKVYTLYVKAVDISVRGSKIIPEGSAPVSVLHFIRNFFVRCKLRSEIASVGDCCTQDMCIMLPWKHAVPWYRCLGFVMTAVVAAVCASPWLLRIWFYNAHEKEAILHQADVLESRNFTIPYTGNMLSYLSPSHTIYLGIYFLFSIEIVLYTCMPNSIKRKLKFTVRKCLRDMRDTPKQDACGLFAANMLLPLKKCGVIGCVFLPVWLILLPLSLCLLALQILPIVNLSVRLLVNLLYYSIKIIHPDICNTCQKPSQGKVKMWIKIQLSSIVIVNNEEANNRSNQIVQAVSLIMSFVSMWLLLFIVIDCIAFYVECTVYALVGFILNPRDTMKYVSLILLIAVYGNDCFSGVHSKYAAYSSAINAEVQSMVGDRVMEVASQSAKEQENTAFRVPAKTAVCERMHLVAGSEKFLKWRIPRLTLFLDKADIPYIPTSFLLEMGKLNHYLCPGVIYQLYLRALLDFSFILIFLMFVFIVIFAFGQAQDISSGGQTIAALGSGFLPLVLRKFLFQSQAGSGVDKSNLKWKNMFANAVQNYADRWNFEDIYVTHTEETDVNPKAEGTCHEISETAMTDFQYNGDDNAAKEASISLLTLEECTDGVNIDLIVEEHKGKGALIFYVPNHSAEHVTNVANNRKPDDVTIV